MTWEEFKDAVINRITDKKPDDAAFSEAQAEYVRARLALELDGDNNAYTIHQNRYTSLRRKLAGYLTTLDAAAQRTAVKALVSDMAPDNTTFALACSYWVKAHTVNEVNRNPQEAGSWMSMYRSTRRRLLGFAHSFADPAALRAAVQPFLAVDMLSDNLTSFLDAQLAAVVSDLQGLGGWFNQQVTASKADLEGLHDRVEKEIRSAVIILQQHVEIYKKGQDTTYTEGQVTPEGFCSSGALPDQAQIREAWIVYPDPDDEGAATTCRRREAVLVPWTDRHAVMLCRECEYPMIAIDPYGRDFLVSPPLIDGEVELELKWDGLKLSFEDADDTPLDESAADAVALQVQSKLAVEFGDGVTVARELAKQADDRMGFCYIEANRRRVVAVPAVAGNFPRCGGCSCASSSSSSSTTLSGYEELAIDAAGTSEISFHPRLKGYHVLARLAEGEGAYTHVISLLAADRASGHTVSILVYLPASVNPRLQIIDAETETAWVDVQHDGEAGWFRGDFTFSGESWSLWGWAPVVGGEA